MSSAASNDSQRKRLSVVIPVYNEERTVAQLLDQVLEAPLSIDKELIIVDDGSTDASARIIEEWHKAHQDSPSFKTVYLKKSNGGKGSAVKEGIKNSTGDVLIIQDADLEYDPNDYESCVRPILEGKCKVVYGSREASNRNRIYSSPAFYLGGLSLTLWMNLLFGMELSDEPTCYKTFDGPLIRSIELEGDKFDWEPEVTAKISRLGFEIIEVPVIYRPRAVNEGKKIKWKDGVIGFWVAFLWRLLPLGKSKRKVLALGGSHAKSVTERGNAVNALLVVLAIALILRALCALPGIADPAKLMRPDSPSYIQPALAMISDWSFNTGPGTGVPALMRTPGYPLYLACLLKISGGSLAFCATISVLLGTLICIPVFLCGRFFGGWKAGFIASLLFALNPTAIALSPMFLSDTLFCALVAFQLYFMLRLLKTGRLPYAAAFATVAGAAALVRPLNAYWTVPAIIVILLSTLTFRRKLIGAVILTAIMIAFTLPWMLRNKADGGGLRIDSIAAESAYLHNSAVLISKLTGEPASAVREKIFNEVQNEFKSNPGKYKTPDSMTTYKEHRFIELVKEHPLSYLLLHARPYTLIPDIPSLLQNLGLTQGEKNTFDILTKEGPLAATKSYFNGKYWLLALVLPLLLIVVLTYAGATYHITCAIGRLDFQFGLLFLLFIAFYLLIPGPVMMPRYQLPALPLLCLMSGWAAMQTKWLKPDAKAQH